MNIRSGRSVILLGVFLICLLPACGPTAAETPEALTLKVSWTFREGDYTLLVADALGYFEEHGLQVEPLLYEPSGRALPDLASAEIEGSLLSMGELILASNSSDLRAIMAYDSGPLYSIVASPAIASAADLVGKRVGVNIHTSGGMFALFILDRVLPTARQVQFIEMSPEQVVQSIPERVEAGLVWEPFTSRALEAGNHVLYTSEEYPALVPGLIVFRRAVVDQHPEAIRAFLLAWNAAVTYRQSNPQEALALISQATGLPASQLGITGKDKLYTISDNLALFSDPDAGDPSSIYYVADFNLNYIMGLGDITNLPDLDSILDPSFLR
jgi:NitT/TauT family transport system substrate-binding protein